jgi:hypothetical protein
MFILGLSLGQVKIVTLGFVGPLGFKIGRHERYHCFGYKPRTTASQIHGGANKGGCCQMIDIVVDDRAAGLTNTFVSAIRPISRTLAAAS